MKKIIGAMVAIVFMSASSWAADLRWDANGSGADISNLSGNWSSSAVTWTNTTAKTSVAWTSGTDNAQFGGTGSTGAGGIVTVAAGGVTVNNLSIQAPASGNFDFQGGTITLNGTMSNSGSNNITNTCAIAGSGSVTRSTGGRYIFLAQNNYAGTTTINASCGIQLGDASHVGTFGQGDVTNNGTIYAQGTGTYTIANNISGSGVLTKTLGSTIIMSGALSFSGTITAVGGTIQMNNIPNSSTSAKIAYNGGTITFIGTANSTCDRLIQVGTAGGTITANLGNDSATGALDMTATGAITQAGGIAAGSGVKLQGLNTGDNYFRAQIVDLNSIAIKFTKDGAGKWILTNTSNSYTGGTTITAGTLSLGASGVLSTTGTISMNGGALQFSASNTTDYTSGSRLKIEDGKTATFDTNGQSVSFANAFTLGTGGTGGLIKSGAGTLTLSGNNSYTGATSISQGTLALTGAGDIGESASIDVASGAMLDVSALAGWSVAGGQTLKGNGTITGNTTVAGTLAPGNSIGQLTVNGDVILSGTSDFEINQDSTSADLLVVQGTHGALTYGGMLNVTSLGTGLYSLNQTFNLFDFTSQSGAFSSVTLPDLSGQGYSWDQSALYTAGTITVIPEPATVGLIGLVGMMSLLRRRMKLRK